MAEFPQKRPLSGPGGPVTPLQPHAEGRQLRWNKGELLSEIPVGKHDGWDSVGGKGQGVRQGKQQQKTYGFKMCGATAHQVWWDWGQGVNEGRDEENGSEDGDLQARSDT